MEKIYDIDWGYWLKRLKLEDKEILVLTMGLNPDAIDPVTYDVDLYFLEDAPHHIKDAHSQYIKRKTLLKEHRFKRFDYFDDSDWGYYFSATPPGAEIEMVLVKRFLLWLKNEEIGWKLPSELQAYIEKLGKPKEPYLAKELIDNHNNKASQSLTSEPKLNWSLKPLYEIKRMNGYRAVLYQTLQTMHNEGKPTPPTAHEVLASWRNEFKNRQPRECNIWVLEKSFDYDNKAGTKKNVDTKSLSSAIQRLITTN